MLDALSLKAMGRDWAWHSHAVDRNLWIGIFKLQYRGERHSNAMMSLIEIKYVFENVVLSLGLCGKQMRCLFCFPAESNNSLCKNCNKALILFVNKSLQAVFWFCLCLMAVFQMHIDCQFFDNTPSSSYICRSSIPYFEADNENSGHC